jgi:hypothetical protein
MFLSKQSLISPWEDILVMSDTFYSAVEQSTVSWDSWPSIQTWWDRLVDSLRSRRVVKPNRKFKLDKDSDYGSSSSANGSGKGKSESQKSKLIAGLPIGWYTSNFICIKYNSGTCDKVESHPTVMGNHTLKHICGGCFKLGKGEDSSHPANNCKFKDQFFG